MTQSNIQMLIQPTLKGLSAAFLLLVIVSCQGSLPAIFYRVKRVSDGDTLVAINTKGKELTVRFACLDAPEIPHSQKEKQSTKAVDRDQFMWGLKAQERIQELVKKGGDRVLLTITDTDQYHRQISEVRLSDGTFLQEVLLREGLAMVYRPYLKNCPSSAIAQKAEAEAKKSRRGVWGDSNFVPAWEFRHNRQ